MDLNSIIFLEDKERINSGLFTDSRDSIENLIGKLSTNKLFDSFSNLDNSIESQIEKTFGKSSINSLFDYANTPDPFNLDSFSNLDNSIESQIEKIIGKSSTNSLFDYANTSDPFNVGLPTDLSNYIESQIEINFDENTVDTFSAKIPEFLNIRNASEKTNDELKKVYNELKKAKSILENTAKDSDDSSRSSHRLNKLIFVITVLMLGMAIQTNYFPFTSENEAHSESEMVSKSKNNQQINHSTNPIGDGT